MQNLLEIMKMKKGIILCLLHLPLVSSPRNVVAKRHLSNSCQTPELNNIYVPTLQIFRRYIYVLVTSSSQNHGFAHNQNSLMV